MRRQIAGLALLLVLPGFLFSPAAADDKKPSLTAEEIINKHIEAIGGRDAISRFKTRIAIGTVKKENDPEAKMAIMSELPNRVSAVFLFPSYDLKFSYDGSNAALQPQLPPRYGPFANKYREMLASGLMFNGISLYNHILQSSEDIKLQAKGTKKVRGRDAYVIEAKRSKGETTRLYFDAQNFMWVRTDYGKAHISAEIKPFTNDPVAHGEDELTVDFYIETSDFRDVEGVKLPFKFEQTVTVPILRQSKSGTISGVITEYRHNETIDPQMFQ